MRLDWTEPTQAGGDVLGGAEGNWEVRRMEEKELCLG